MYMHVCEYMCMYECVDVDVRFTRVLHAVVTNLPRFLLQERQVVLGELAKDPLRGVFGVMFF